MSSPETRNWGCTVDEHSIEIFGEVLVPTAQHAAQLVEIPPTFLTLKLELRIQGPIGQPLQPQWYLVRFFRMVPPVGPPIEHYQRFEIYWQDAVVASLEPKWNPLG